MAVPPVGEREGVRGFRGMEQPSPVFGKFEHVRGIAASFPRSTKKASEFRRIHHWPNGMSGLPERWGEIPSNPDLQ